MADITRNFRVLVASPGDCQEERAAICDALRHWNEIYGQQCRVTLRPLLWEDDAQPELGNRPQELINKQLVSDADAVVAVFWKRLGSPTGVAASGTAEEIEQFMTSGRPAMVYFSKRLVDLAEIDTEQLAKLREYKKHIEQHGLVGEFSSPIDLREKVEKNLAALINRLLLQTKSTKSFVLPEQLRQQVQTIMSTPQSAREQLYAVKSSHQEDYDVVFEPSNAVAFYDEIAEQYDARQSDELLETHYAVIAALRRALVGRNRPTVLDLGGGTGSEIATHFAPRDDLKWVYVDSSESMVRRFSRNLRKARMSTTVILGQMERQMAFFLEEGDRFDVIILSWLLSSVTADPLFDRLTRLLKEDGRLVIADAERANLEQKPLYGVATLRRRLALRLRPINPLQLQQAALGSGLTVAEPALSVRKPDGSPYSFLQVYSPKPD